MRMEFLSSVILSLVRKKANRLTIEILYGNYCDRNTHSTLMELRKKHLHWSRGAWFKEVVRREKGEKE